MYVREGRVVLCCSNVLSVADSGRRRRKKLLSQEARFRSSYNSQVR